MPTTVANDKLYANSVNPQWVRLLDVLQMNVPFAHCEGAELFQPDGKRVLDFLSGYCVHNTGHNHPHIIAALKEELDRSGPVMLQSHVPELAGELAWRLCESAGGRLKKAHFTSSGSEGVEAAIKFARAHTGRVGLLFAEGAFHGLTCGALSLMGNAFWRKGFGPLLPEAQQIPFGDVESLEAELATKKCAAFIVETIQGEGGIRIPDAQYLQRAQALCRQHGSLFILDEVQTGLYRTGRFLAAQHFGLDPDMVILAKALSGGLVPVGAVLTTDDIYNSVYSSLHRAIIHTSTFSENSLAMRAGLATLEVLESGRLGARALSMGQYLRQRLQDVLAGYEMVKEVRGLGLFCGVEFQAPRQWALRASYETFRRIHPGMFGQMLVMNLFRKKGILTQMCGNNFQVLKVAPPLVVTDGQVDEFVSKLAEVVESIHASTTFWTEALGLARRVVNI
ncbi:MAG: aspartate aminotransferase family protein [Terriglobia bacterium]|jgi:ornithine--oxo-acid transaminase